MKSNGARGASPIVGIALASVLLAACGGNEFSAGGDDDGAAAGRSSGNGSGGSSGTGSGSGASDGSGGSSGSSSSPAGCLDFVRAGCERSARCAGESDDWIGDCVELGKDNCVWYALPGVDIGAAEFRACVDSYDSTECGEYPICDLPKGTRGNGFSCVTWIQCESGYCSGNSSACGVCGPDPQHELGEACEEWNDCKSGLNCVDHICTAPAQEGEACGGERSCDYYSVKDAFLTCVDGICTAVGLLGGPCYASDPNFAGTTCGQGAACNENAMCVPYVYAEVGEPCGDMGDQVVACRNGSCQSQDDEGTVLLCVSWAGPGERCDKIPNYSKCSDGLQCNESEICVWPQPAMPPTCDD